VRGLTATEKANTMAAIRFLRTRCGTWRLLAKALGTEPSTMRNVKKRLKLVSVTMAFQVSRLAGVPLDHVTEGKYPVTGVCPHCGRCP
jgi:hypothetical protein